MKKIFSLRTWLLLAVLVRVYKILVTKCIASDGVAYIGAAKDLLEGSGFNPIWPPLYPWLISLLWRAGINPELSGQLISLIFGVLTVALIYILSKKITGSEIVSNIAVIFSVFHPFLVRYSAETLSDSLFTFLITLSIYYGWLVIESGKREKTFFRVFITGVVLALAYLTKPEGIFILIIISLWWIIFPLVKIKLHKGLWYRNVFKVVFVWIVFFVVCLPYLYAVKSKSGDWIISQKQTIVFSIALQSGGYEEEFLNVSPLEYAKEKPKIFFSKVGSDLLTVFGKFPDAYFPLLFILLLIGIMGRDKEKKYLLYILSFLIPFFIGYAVYHPGRRYLVGWVPLTIFLSAYGIININKWTKINTWILVIITVFIMFPKTFAPIRKNGARWKEAGLWIKDYGKKNPVVMCEDERTAFYADGENVILNDENYRDETNRVDYIVTDMKIDTLKRRCHTSLGLNIYYGEN